MKDFPARPITTEEKKDILAESVRSCRDKEQYDLFIEIQEKLKDRGFKNDFQLIEEILNM